VVTVPSQEQPWKVSNAAFRLLVAEVEDLTTDAGFMVQAAALNGLHLDMATPEERQRQAKLLALAAQSLRAKLLKGAPSEWELELAHHLPVLEMWLEGVAEGLD